MQAFFRPDNQNFVSELLKIYPEATQLRNKQEYLTLHYVHYLLFHHKDSFNVCIEKELII